MKIKITTGKTCIEYEQETVTDRAWSAMTDPSTGMGGTGNKPKMREVFMQNLESLCEKAKEMEKTRISEDLL